MRRTALLLILVTFVTAPLASAQTRLIQGIPVANNPAPRRGILVTKPPPDNTRYIMGQPVSPYQPQRGILLATPYQTSYTSTTYASYDTGVVDAILGVALVGGLVALAANADYTSFSYGYNSGYQPRYRSRYDTPHCYPAHHSRSSLGFSSRRSRW